MVRRRVDGYAERGRSSAAADLRAVGAADLQGLGFGHDAGEVVEKERE